MQMARVLAAVANGGIAVPVHVVADETAPGEKILDRSEAAALAEMLRLVVTSGTATTQLGSMLLLGFSGTYNIY